MLKSGTITVPQREKSVYTCCPELYNSSSSEVVIELVPVRSGDDFRTVSCTDKDLINSGYELKDLSLDLRKCPNLTSIVGKKLGTKGAKLLSQYISLGIRTSLDHSHDTFFGTELSRFRILRLERKFDYLRWYQLY